MNPASPKRCQHSTSRGQCEDERTTHHTFCPRHAPKDAYVSNYMVPKWQDRIENKSRSKSAKSLQDEVGILRMTLEAILDKCEDSHDLFVHSGPIGDLTQKIDKLVNSTHKLDLELGQLMDKNQAMALGNQITEILTKHISDPVLLTAIATDIGNVLSRSDPSKDSKPTSSHDG